MVKDLETSIRYQFLNSQLKPQLERNQEIKPRDQNIYITNYKREMHRKT